MTASTTTRRANHLAGETSLYLQMHAWNPVDWYPWGEEAFAKARAEGKPIFLSIGYSSCHWCHVMERESFLDEEVAEALNRDFVAIKVDREERPEIDEIYMTALQMYLHLIRSPQSGGWPLTMFLTPDARPVLGGTYFPPRDRAGHMGLLGALRLVRQAWQQQPEEIRQNAEVITQLVQQQLQHAPAKATALDRALVQRVLAALIEQYDPTYGGFGYSDSNAQHPKFPQPASLVFLLDCARRQGGTAAPQGSDLPVQERQRVLSMLVTTLDHMAAGGIRDHLGGGFHRYSTDRFWRIPHFEKMLYDNGQLASVYAEAYQLTKRESYRHVVEQTLEFVQREMTSPEGGFYTALDAETDGVEGQYYVWTQDELRGALSAEQFALFREVYEIEDQGNFEGRCVLLLRRPLAETAQQRKLSENDLHRRLAAVRERLLAVRHQRPRPLTDTKILTSWNGLMIRGFADAGRLLSRQAFVEVAQKGADFVLDKLCTPEGRLLRTYGDGRAKYQGYLDDYALLVDGLIGLHQATGQRKWLEEADRLTAAQIRLFWDDPQGGFFYTSSDHEPLIARSKDVTDSAMPSSNAVSASNLLYLARALDRPEYAQRAEDAVRAFAPLMEQVPAAMPRMAVALQSLLAEEGGVSARRA